MSWTSLGSKVLTPEWQLFDIPVIGTELFRVKNTWTIKPVYRMRAYLGQFFGTTNEVFVSTKRIYPYKDLFENVELVIPQDLKESGVITRYIGIKLYIPSRVGVAEYDWTLELEEYTASSTKTQQTNTGIFPGQIPGLF